MELNGILTEEEKNEDGSIKLNYFVKTKKPLTASKHSQ